jgi:hypothetical protein
MPAALTGGIYNLQFAAHNGVEPDAVQNFALTVSEAPGITSIAQTSCAIGIPCTFTVTTIGFPDPAITQTGDTLPADLLFFDNGDGTATFSGTPTAGTDGNYSLVFTATNGIGTDAVQNFTLTVNPSLAITSADTATCVVGSTCTFTITTNGIPVPTIARTGDALPSALDFVDNGDGTATLFGTAGPGTGGIYNLTLTASNGVEADAVQSFTLIVNQVPQITSAASKTCTVGASCTFTVITSGFPVSTIGQSGDTLPTALSFIDNGDGTAAISGTPSSGTSGVYNVIFTASNGVPPDAVQNFSLSIATSATLDVDSSAPSTPYDALTDGLLVVRYLFGLTGSSLTTGALGPTATRTDPTVVKAYLDGIRPALDVDGNGIADALTDGLLIVRYLFGLRGDALISGALDPLATRTTAAAVEAYLQTLMP